MKIKDTKQKENVSVYTVEHTRTTTVEQEYTADGVTKQIGKLERQKASLESQLSVVNRDLTRFNEIKELIDNQK